MLSLKIRILQIANPYISTLEILFENTNLRKYFPFYKDIEKEKFEEVMRRKIIELKLKIENLEKEPD